MSPLILFVFFQILFHNGAWAHPSPPEMSHFILDPPHTYARSGNLG